MNFKDIIIRDPKIRGGVPVIKGTDITLKSVLGHLVLGDSNENILKAYPGLTEEALKVVIAFAAAVADVDLPDPPPQEHPLPGPAKLEKSEAFLKKKLLTDEQVSQLLSGLHFRKS
jgi:uncharacterized protein (DUF433 family)